MVFWRKRASHAHSSDKLHVGCGPQILPGWINVDNQRYPGVDRVLDVTRGLPFTNLRYIFAEHFIEHLAYDDGLAFMGECRRALAGDGVLRLSTPNLDWVWVTHYHFREWSAPHEAVRDCFALNKAFRGWGHQFLYNFTTLSETLRAAGFADVVSVGYGESGHADLRGLERHEKYPDAPDLPHIVIVEASGRADASTSAIAQPLAEFREAVAAK